MLKLRRGIVTSTDPLIVRVGEEERRAWADEEVVGPVREGLATPSFRRRW